MDVGDVLCTCKGESYNVFLARSNMYIKAAAVLHFGTSALQFIVIITIPTL